MRHLFFIRANALRKTLAGVFVVLVLVGSGTLAVPKKADAGILDIFGGGNIVLDPSNLIKNTITAAQQAASTGLLSALNLKELTLDGIAWSLAKKVLAQSVASVVDWINSGFNGKPAFITDYDKYFLNAADRVAGDFISKSNFAQLCQPLQMPVRFILDLSYRQARDYQEHSQCTLSSAAGNVNNFLNGHFEDGGWNQWFSMVSNPQNNIYGATAIATQRLQDTVIEERDVAKTEAIIGQGFMSVKNCNGGKCVIVTPGSVISQYLNFSLTVGDRVLIQADQINEVIGSLFSQLGKQAITGANGLLGLSYSQNGTTPSYISQFSNETAAFGAQADAKFLTDAIALETQYQNIFVKAANDLDAMMASFGVASSTASTTVAVPVTLCPALVQVAKDAVALQTKYDGETATTQSIIDVLNLLLTNFQQSKDASVMTVIVQQFQKLQSDGTLHTTAATTEQTFTVAGEVTALKNRAAAATSTPGCK